MTPQQRDKTVTDLYSSGLSVLKVAEQTGIHQSTVNNIVRKYGIARPGRRLGRDITGKRFGKLVAMYVSDVHRLSGEKFWRCQCDCGAYTTVRLGSLTSGDSRSCGCFSAELRRKSRAKANSVKKVEA